MSSTQNNFTTEQKENELLMKSLLTMNKIDINRFKKFKEVNHSGKAKEFKITWEQCLSLINKLKSNIRELKNETNLKEMVIQNLESEKFILNDTMQNLQNELSKSEIIKQGLHNEIEEYQTEINELTRDCNYKQGEIDYQKNRKIKARRKYHELDELYKQSMNENIEKEIKLKNIEKRLRGLKENKVINALHYFKDMFPDEEYMTCELCCNELTKSHFINCKNEKCNIELCVNCNAKVSKCPYCQYEDKPVEDNDDDVNNNNNEEDIVLDYEDDDEDSFYDYESDGEDDYLQNIIGDYTSIDTMIYNMFNEDDDGNCRWRWNGTTWLPVEDEDNRNNEIIMKKITKKKISISLFKLYNQYQYLI